MGYVTFVVIIVLFCLNFEISIDLNSFNLQRYRIGKILFRPAMLQNKFLVITTVLDDLKPIKVLNLFYYMEVDLILFYTFYILWT